MASAPAMIAMIPAEPDVAKRGASQMPERLEGHEQQVATQISFGVDSRPASTADGAHASELAVEGVQLGHEVPAETFAIGSGDDAAAADEDLAMDAWPAAFPLQATVPAAMAAASVDDSDAEPLGEATLIEQQLTLAQAAAASYDAPSLLGSTDEARF